jgi:integrase
LSARTGQDGTLYQKGRRQDEAWQPDKPAYLRYHLDIPGQHERVKPNVSLGVHLTREAARRKADKWIMENNINSKERIADALQPTEATFRSQSAAWLSDIASGRIKCRQRSKRGRTISPNTLDSYTSAVAYLNQQIGDKPLAAFDNAEMRELIATMEAEEKQPDTPRFSTKTINNYYNNVVAVFATAKDRRGNPLFPRKWDVDYIGLPAVQKEKQRRPTCEAHEIEAIVAAAGGLFQLLYCLLAGTGPRISEAVALEIGKHFSSDCSTIYIRQQRSKKGGIVPYAKTDAGIRDIDLHPSLAALVRRFIGNRTSGFLFETSNGTMFSPLNISHQSLQPILKEMGRYKPGSAFNIFRRFREAVLLESPTLRGLLIDYWMGHANAQMQTRYGKQLIAKVAWRQRCAKKAGLGFKLPAVLEVLDGQPGQLSEVNHERPVAA